jgi:hypothetical protein
LLLLGEGASALSNTRHAVPVFALGTVELARAFGLSQRLEDLPVIVTFVARALRRLLIVSGARVLSLET